MKKWKKILVMVVCLCLAQVVALSIKEPVKAETVAVKTGLQKENGKYYYYVKGTKVTNTWKTVKVTKDGKTQSYRYYFSKSGAAYAGKKLYGVNTPAVKKINGKYYGFGLDGRMLKGTYVIGIKFYVFNSKTGVYDSAKSQTLRKASTYQKDAAEIKKLLGKPKKIVTMKESCYGDGQDIIWYYTNYLVTFFRDKNGKDIVLALYGR